MTKEELLQEMFVKFINEADYAIADDFKINHDTDILKIDDLQAEGKIELQVGKFVFSLKSYIASEWWKQEENTIDRLIPTLKKFYKQNRDQLRPVDEVAAEGILEINDIDIQRVLMLLDRFGVLGGHSKDERTNRIASFRVGEEILRFNTIKEKIERDRKRNVYYTVGLPDPEQVTFELIKTAAARADILLSNWESVKELGTGGQGKVSLVWRAKEVPTLISEMAESIRDPAVSSAENRAHAARRLADAMSRFIEIKSPAKFAALKQLHNKGSGEFQKAIKRMQGELKALKEVDHRHIVKVYEDNLADGWFVMEYFPQGSLSKHKDRFKGNVALALRAIREVVDGVRVLHQKGMVHRDIKPDNIFVRDDGGLAWIATPGQRLTL